MQLLKTNYSLNPANGDFHLLSGSEAIDAGTSLAAPVVLSDIDGNPRTSGTGFDIGAYEYSAVTGISHEDVIKGFELFQNYPNPFNPETKIRYTLPLNGYVTLKIYNILGVEIETLVNNIQPAGIYEVNFNAGNLASGIYLYHLKAGSFTAVKKLILLR